MSTSFVCLCTKAYWCCEFSVKDGHFISTYRLQRSCCACNTMDVHVCSCSTDHDPATHNGSTSGGRHHAASAMGRAHATCPAHGQTSTRETTVAGSHGCLLVAELSGVSTCEQIVISRARAGERSTRSRPAALGCWRPWHGPVMNKVFCRAKSLQTEPCSAGDAADVIQGFLDRVGAASGQVVSFKRQNTSD